MLTATLISTGPGNQSWRVPDGVSVVALPSCNMDAEAFVLRDAAELQASLSGWAEMRLGLGLPLIFSVRFSGHAEASGSSQSIRWKLVPDWLSPHASPKT